MLTFWSSICFAPSVYICMHTHSCIFLASSEIWFGSTHKNRENKSCSVTFSWEEIERSKREPSLFCGLYRGVWSLSFLDCVVVLWAYDKIWLTAVTALGPGLRLPLESCLCESLLLEYQLPYGEGEYDGSVWETVKSGSIFQPHFSFSF